MLPLSETLKKNVCLSMDNFRVDMQGTLEVTHLWNGT